MPTIADSSAFLDSRRLLSQHQAALTIMQGMLDNPILDALTWLDLCCGKGQIIINLEENLSQESRSKIEYSAYDLKDEYLQSTIKKAETLGFKQCKGKSGDISDFPVLHPSKEKFDFISLTNSLHEFDPKFIPQFLIESILRLSEDGILFLYDMEHLPSYELGAVTWSFEEIQEITSFLLNLCGVSNGYVPRAGKWRHKNVTAWNSQIQKKYIGVTDNQIIELLPSAILNGKAKIKEILQRKLELTKKGLEVLTNYGASNQEEEEKKLKLLHDFWALNRYLSL